MRDANYVANKVSDDIYIVTEDNRDEVYYTPYVVGKTNLDNGYAMYTNFDEAMLEAIAVKYYKGTDDCALYSMINAVRKLLDMEE